MKKYIIILFVLSLGCKKENDQSSSVRIYVPDAFYPLSSVACPNGDISCNKVFHVVVDDPSKLSSYELSIYGHNQVLIFHTTDISLGWNGLLNNNGAALEQGAYPFVIKYTDTNHHTNYISKNVTLVR